MDRRPGRGWSRYGRSGPCGRLGNRRLGSRGRFASRWLAGWRWSIYVHIYVHVAIVVIPQHRVVKRVISVTVPHTNGDTLARRQGKPSQSEGQHESGSLYRFSCHLHVLTASAGKMRRWHSDHRHTQGPLHHAEWSRQPQPGSAASRLLLP